MKNDELKEIITQAHMAGQHCADPDIGNASYSDAFAYFSTLTEPKEQDVCPKCDGTGKKFNDFGLPDKDCPSCNGKGKAPVDKIREAFENWYLYSGASKIPEPDLYADRIAFEAGYKSQQAEIERLKKTADNFRKSLNAEIKVKYDEIHKYIKEADKLKAENEAMRCCGNCGKRYYYGIDTKCDEIRFLERNGSGKCSLWCLTYQPKENN